MSWKDRKPSKSLSLIIVEDGHSCSLTIDEDNMEIIEKYKNLGIIKKFETYVEKNNESLYL